MWSGEHGRITGTEQRIDLKLGARAVHEIRYIQGPKMRVVMKIHVEEKVHAGVIEPANSEWASSVVSSP